MNVHLNGSLPLHAKLAWGAPTARERGPILLSGAQANAIGAYAGNYAPYRAMAVATGALDAGHRPDLSATHPVAEIGPFDTWVRPFATMDKFGHRVAEDFAEERATGFDIRPTIAVARGELRFPEILEALSAGRIKADGRVLHHDGSIHVTKIAIEPVWHLPSLAARIGVKQCALRTALVEQSGGMYPAICTRPDIELFLPPIGGTSIYLFGDPARLGSAALVTCRIHDECNGSDVFGSDMCTCRPYLSFGIEACIQGAQQGGIGILSYNRKEGRSLGEVVKYLVYNARPRAACGDREEDYFARTRAVAGVEDMRFQSMATDPLLWLGVRKIDRWASMSNLKSDALRRAGIEIGEHLVIPDDLVPQNARVEIGAKKTSGYFF
ncbi:GTP cyclohydrolase II [Cypionkella sp. TWP1-2-1b2]|uniref:GTP cyclohydrolase II n=1 Tax=Cypionkella sp. TWP1-2-1b2 TaxID=2804675 RepID=UPI003CE8F7CB